MADNFDYKKYLKEGKLNEKAGENKGLPSLVGKTISKIKEHDNFDWYLEIEFEDGTKLEVSLWKEYGDAGVDLNVYDSNNPIFGPEDKIDK